MATIPNPWIAEGCEFTPAVDCSLPHVQNPVRDGEKDPLVTLGYRGGEALECVAVSWPLQLGDSVIIPNGEKKLAIQGFGPTPTDRSENFILDEARFLADIAAPPEIFRPGSSAKLLGLLAELSDDPPPLFLRRTA